MLLPDLSGGWQLGASSPGSLWVSSQLPPPHCLPWEGTGASAAVAAMLPVRHNSGDSWFLPPLLLQGQGLSTGRMLQELRLKSRSRMGLSRRLVVIQRHREQPCLQVSTPTICVAREVFMTGSLQTEPLLFHYYKKKSLQIFQLKKKSISLNSFCKVMGLTLLC